jgi:hypothetical protein
MNIHLCIKCTYTVVSPMFVGINIHGVGGLGWLNELGSWIINQLIQARARVAQ